jgi:amidase
MAPIAHGNDGGGSIRIPASCNGLVGLKASRGLVPNDYIEMEGFVTDGVLTRTVADTAALLDVLAVTDPRVFFSAPRPADTYAHLATLEPPKLRIGFTTSAPLGMAVDPECAAAVTTAIDALASCGHEVVEASFDLGDTDAFLASFMAVWNTGSVWSPVEDYDAIEPVNTALRAAARAVDSLTFAESVRTMQRAVKVVIAPFGRDFDVLVTPTMAVPPPLVGSWREGADADPMAALLNCYPMGVFTSIFNVTGLPAISLPVHQSHPGLPIGVQLVAEPWHDEVLLRLGTQLERVCSWRERRPALAD